jgi:D-beta-D-heptose 7-phosphate kinase/D-beta-D-heptose 1-phosphate adenosyltransferase
MHSRKIVHLDELEKIVKKAKSQGKRIVWTNGCFDLLHAGHVIYLEKARALGDMLIVGLNSDASVKKWKSPDRPLVSQFYRARVVTALACVDYVVIFDASSPVKLLERVQPDIFTKGDDYSVETMDQAERRAVERYGGEFRFLSGIPGMSTSALLARIRGQESNLKNQT